MDDHKKWEYIAEKVSGEETEEPFELNEAGVKDLTSSEKTTLQYKDNKKTIDDLLDVNADKALLQTRNKFKQETRQKFILLAAKYAAIIVIAVVIGGLIQNFRVNSDISYSTVKVPFGQMAQLELPDGTYVWLNSQSEIKYPERFNGKTRDVKLTGEAHFDVVKNPDKPFNIHTERLIAHVTGTSLNVQAYHNENISTTLVEGKVSILGKDGKLISVLKPGQSAVLNMNNQLAINNVDTKPFTMWKEGKLFINNETIEELAKKLERWYNVEIKFKDEEIKKYRLSGTVLKYKPVNQILAILATKDNIGYDLKVNPNDKNIFTLYKK